MAMQLTPLELFALDKLLDDQESVVLALQCARVKVLERVETPDGFYSVIELEQPPSGFGRLVEREWRFRIRNKSAGGYFVCWPDGESNLCLEAVLGKGMPVAMLTPELLV
ncbi:hypothetical protein SA496_11460 [Pseudomonas sp. JS3066]|jgi:hypothetical protein|uniref:hypothetical protein n=2 Tax=Pseudomonas TaxID=286 RepID=UPI0013C51321|nr:MULTISPECIES: hypothetical protein [unclassified Pseudomonas]WVK95750.1 hypothetical protein SA496_11460 [Pseudomonas sp. JS3066]